MLTEFAADEGVELRRFSQSHYRIMGANQVDYWPGTGKAWLVGSFMKAVNASPASAILMSRNFVILPEGAEDHLKNI